MQLANARKDHSSPLIRKELNTGVTFDVNQVRLEASSVFFADSLIPYLSESKGFLCLQTEFPSSMIFGCNPPPLPTPVIFSLRRSTYKTESIVESFFCSHPLPHPNVLSAHCAIPAEINLRSGRLIAGYHHRAPERLVPG